MFKKNNYIRKYTFSMCIFRPTPAVRFKQTATKNTHSHCVFLWRFLSFTTYIVFCSCRVSICRLSRGGAYRCLCRISTPYSRRTHLSSSIRDCDMARICFPISPRNRLYRYCLGDSRYGCWCMPICYRRKAPMQSTIQLGKCSSGRALCPRIRPRNLRN